MTRFSKLLIIPKKEASTGLLRRQTARNLPTLMSVDTNESATWNAFRQGDRAAFGQLYFEHYEVLLNYGRRFGVPAEGVEDTIQDLFVELWQYRATLSMTTSVRFYLLRALRNQLSKHRRAPVFTAVETDELPFAVEFSFEQQWIDALEEKQQKMVLQQALNALTPRQREVLYLRFFSDLDYPQIAEVMGLSYQATRNQVYLALKAIREHLPLHWAALIVLVSKMVSLNLP